MERATFTAPARLEIVRKFDAPIEKVWSYLMDPELRATWFCGGAWSDTAGGVVTFEFDHRRISDVPPPVKYENENVVTMVGKMLEIEAPTLMKFTWAEGDAGDSTVTIRLRETGGETELHLIHEKVPTGQEASIQGGWHAHLDLMVDAVSGLKPRDFWLHYGALEANYEQA